MEALNGDMPIPLCIRKGAARDNKKHTPSLYRNQIYERLLYVCRLPFIQLINKF